MSWYTGASLYFSPSLFFSSLLVHFLSTLGCYSAAVWEVRAERAAVMRENRRREAARLFVPPPQQPRLCRLTHPTKIEPLLLLLLMLLVHYSFQAFFVYFSLIHSSAVLHSPLSWGIHPALYRMFTVTGTPQVLFFFSYFSSYQRPNLSLRSGDQAHVALTYSSAGHWLLLELLFS